MVRRQFCFTSLSPSLGLATPHPPSRLILGFPTNLVFFFSFFSVGPEYYVTVMSFVDQDKLEPGCTVLMHNKSNSIVGILDDDTDPMVSVMKVTRLAP